MFAERRAAIGPFAVLGTGCVIAGGSVAAVTAASPTVHGTWAAAYLVLVAGVAQVALGVGRAVLATEPPTRPRVTAETLGWNLGNAFVLGGVLADLMPMVDVGGALLVAGLALFAHGVRGHGPDGAAWTRWARHAFRALSLVLLVSIPVGLLLARFGPS